MNLYLLTPPHEYGGHNMDQLVMATSASGALEIWRATFGDAMLFDIDPDGADRDDRFIVRELPSVRAPSIRGMAKIVEWDKCEFSFWKATPQRSADEVVLPKPKKKFTVTRKWDAWVNYSKEFEAETAEEALELAKADGEDWGESTGTDQFDEHMYTVEDQDGNEVYAG